MSTSDNHTGFDTHLCYARTKPVAMGDGMVRIYYSGSNGPHAGNNRSSFIGLASVHEQRFSGITNSLGNAVSTLQTTPLRCTDKRLLITADIRTSIRVGVGEPGMLLSDAVPLYSGNVTDQEVAWSSGNDFTPFLGHDVVLIFELTNAIVYQVSWH